MKDVNGLFWGASLAELKRGYVYEAEEECWLCLFCGKARVQGVVYPHGEAYLDAEKAMRQHIKEAHGSVFEQLLKLDDKYTGLTPHQKKMLMYFQQGLEDKEIVAALKGGSPSTVRQYRFAFKEREKQAKIFLALAELLREPKGTREAFLPAPRTATQVDERWAITEKEYASLIRTYFKSGPAGPLTVWPKTEKRRIAILRHLIQRFDAQKQYREADVNALLKKAYPDFALLRRYLIEYGFMERTPDGNAYWRKS